ncbi:SSD domain-containing protein [Aphelenchoides bicaudatus]|nr:SSD domain-containing protein [Aphelenchoides bicaudatus]
MMKQVAASKEDVQDCKRFGKSFLKWMNKNHNKWRLFLDENELPSYPRYGHKTSDGCRGFGKELMKWPREMITGQRNDVEYNAFALQTSFLLTDAEEFYYRILHSEHGHPSPYFTIESADEILKAWKHRTTFVLCLDIVIVCRHAQKLQPL